jgi:HemY protein
MLRLIAYVIEVALIGAVAIWFVEHPGRVRFDWQGWRIDTSVGVVVLAVALLALAIALTLRFRHWLVHAPAEWRRRREARRRARGYEALSRGMVAVAAGDPADARRYARRADVLLHDPPLTMLLSAQAAQLEGDDGAAERYFTLMQKAPETEFLGLRGLLTQALRKDDRARARALAERAYELRPASPWLVDALYELRAESGDWLAAGALIQDAERHRVLEAGEARHRRAVVTTERAAKAAAAGEAEEARRLAKQAIKLEPGLVPATVILARALLQMGKRRRALAALESAWAETPHPDLARALGELDQNPDPIQRLKELERFVASRAEHPESHFALAGAALAAELWGEARRHLKAIWDSAGVTPRLCRLMARLETEEHGNLAEARAWLERVSAGEPDPAWVCDACGAAAAVWSGRCAHCGRIGQVSWKQPPRVATMIASAASPAAALAAPRGAALPPEPGESRPPSSPPTLVPPSSPAASPAR